MFDVLPELHLAFPEILKIWVFKVSFALNFHSTSELPSRTFALFFGIVQEPFGMHCSVIKVPYVICVTAYDLVFRRPFSGRALLSYQTLFPLSTAFWEKFRAFFRVFFTPDSHLCTRFRAPTRDGVSGQDRPGIPGPSTQEAKERIEVIEHARHGIARDIGQRSRAEFGIYHQCKEEIQ